MGKNIFDLYKDENGTEAEVTVESVATPVELILAEAEYEDAVLTMEQALAHAETIETTVGAIAQFEKDFQPVEDALAAGEVTTESAQTAQVAYDALCGNLNISADQLDSIGCTVLTTEDSSQYPEATAKLTKEGAMKLIEAIKTKVAEIIKNIMNAIKKMGVKIASHALNIEKGAAEAKKFVDTELTDELVDGAEINVELVASRMAVFGSLSKDNLMALVQHANNPKVAKDIKDAFDKDIAAKKFENILTLKSGLSVDVKGLFKDGSDDVVTNVYHLGVDGDTVSALVTRKFKGEEKVKKETARLS